MIIQGELTVNGLPRNGATTKLWHTSDFATSPSLNTALPSGSPIASGTTAETNGGDGAYRFNSLVPGEYYVSVEWNGQILYDYYNLTNVNPLPSILDYGADETGVADSTAAFQAAALVNSVIKVPIGTYLISGTIDLNHAYFIGEGWGTANATSRSELKFRNLGTNPAIRTTQANTKTDTVGMENIYVLAESWDSVTGCLGNGLDIEAKITLRNVACLGFKKSNLFLHNDTIGNGPYHSYIEDFYSAYAGQHGIVVGTGANAVTFVNPRSYWSGASGYLAAPGASGSYDGFYVDYANEGNPGSAYFSYSPQALSILGGDASYNSRFGWNFRGFRNSFVAPGYAELNKVNQANIGLNVSYAEFHFQSLSGNETGLTNARVNASDDADVAVWVGGKYYGTGGTNNITRMLENFDIRLFADATNAGNLIRFVAAGTGTPAQLNLNTFGSSVLTVGSNTHFLTVSGNYVDLPRRYYQNDRFIDQDTAAPVAGTFSKGSVYWNTAPASGGPIGWVCVTSGTPGTWIPFGSIPNVKTTTATGTVVMAVTDLILLHNATGGSVTLPTSPTIGVVYRVKDAKGDAGGSNVTIAGASGNIDGAANTTIATNYGVKSFVYDGTNWFSV